MNTGKPSYHLLFPVLLIFFSAAVHAQEIHRRDSVYMKIEDFSKLKDSLLEELRLLAEVPTQDELIKILSA